jgi:hypothetical protein
MTYRTKKNEMFFDIDKSIKNNSFYFDISNIGDNFYNIYKNTHILLGIKYDKIFIEISILFEYLLKCYDIFCKLLDGKSKQENVDILCFLNINIYIITKLNIIFNSFAKGGSLIDEIINLNKMYFGATENITDINSIVNYNFKSDIVTIFNKIINIEGK